MNRDERRQEAQQALKRYCAEGLPAKLSFPAMFAHTAVLLAIATRRADGDRATRLASAFHEGFEFSLASAGNKREVACRAGCHLCCHNWITVTAPEVLLIAAELRARPKADDAALAVAEAAEAGKGLDRDVRLARRLACPLLVERLCSIYAVRPIACRGFFSLSLQACRDVFDGTGEDIPAFRVAMVLRGFHDRCLWAALKAAGLPHGGYELTDALTLALAAGDAEARWLDGEDIFAEATPEEPHDDEEELFLDVLIAGAAGRRLPDNPWI